MRLDHNVLLTLPALLSVAVVAVPSPAGFLQQLPDPPVRQQSWWSSVSQRLIESTWGIRGSPRASDGTSHATAPLSQHSFARYGGDVVLRFNISTVEEAASLAEAADVLMLDVWEFAYDWVDIRLSKDIIPSLLGLLPTSLQTVHTPLLRERDLAHAIYSSYPSSKHSQSSAESICPGERPFESVQRKHDDGESSIFFQEYRSLSVIEPWMRLISQEFSTHVKLINIGMSFEGREILALQVGARPLGSDNTMTKRRRTVLVTGGMHAREWISTTTVNYVAFSMITSYGKTDDVTALLDEYDFIFVPTVNPDGYAYTWNTDRLWRKNRQRTTVRFCQGVDLDHGFGFAWDATATIGNPCSESYAGETPFDAIESRRLADWAKNETENNNVEFVGFLDLHSYSQQILYPYSYSCADRPPSRENLEELALGLEKAIRRSSSMSYEVMPACEGNSIAAENSQAGQRGMLPMIEQAGGSAIDWFYHEMHVKYAYQIKLRDRGTYGFLLPKENIIPTGKEILDAVLYFGEFLKDGYPKQLSADDERAEDESAAESATAQPQLSGLMSSTDKDWTLIEDVLMEGTEEIKSGLRRRRR